MGRPPMGLRVAAGNLLFAAAYVAAARFGLSLAFFHESASAIWPPTGLSIAAVWTLGPRYLPGVFLGAFAANYLTAPSLPASLAIACGNSLETMLSVRLAAPPGARRAEVFERPASTFRYIVLAGLVPTALAASVGALALCATGSARWTDFPPIWTTWWLGDAVSALTIAPFFLIWSAPPRTPWPAWRWGELAALGAAAVSLTVFVFGPWTRTHSLEYLLIPFLIWAAFRLGRRGAVTSVAMISAVAAWRTLQGHGPFVLEGRPNESLLLLQSFIAAIAMMALFLASLVFERLQARRELEAQVDELRQFANVASHDLQEPLRKIITYCERLAARVGGADAETRDQFERVRAAASRMKDVIEDLLVFSRLSNADAPASEQVTLGALLDEAKSDLEVAIARSGASVRLTRDCAFRASRSQMRHVLLNLVGNSIKFARPGVPPAIEVDGERTSGGEVRIRVKDNGIGFDEKYLDRIFKPFQRLHGRGEYEGTGIGLAIVHKIARRHGGRVGASSRPGEGSEFSVYLPA